MRGGIAYCGTLDIIRGMETEKIDHFEQMLSTEKAKLEEDLASVGHKNPENPRDWEATATEENPASADENEHADNIEDYENNTAILKQLETRYNEVLKALEMIEVGTYGVCNTCGKQIEEDRLEANPAAATCKDHMNDEPAEK